MGGEARARRERDSRWRGLGAGSQGLRSGVGGCALSCSSSSLVGGTGGSLVRHCSGLLTLLGPGRRQDFLSFLDSGVSLPRESGGLEIGLRGWLGPLSAGRLAVWCGNLGSPSTLTAGPGEGSVAALPVVLRGAPAEGASWSLVLPSPSAPSPCSPCCVSPRSLEAQAFGPTAVTHVRVRLGLLPRWPGGPWQGPGQGEAVRPLVPRGPS